MMRGPLSYLPLASGFLVLVLSLALGVLTITSRNNASSQSLNTKAAEQPGIVSLSPSSGDYPFSSGSSYQVGIIVNSAERSLDGADIIIRFDPTKVQVEGTKITTGNLFEDYIVNSVDNVRGQIKVGAVTFTSKPVAGLLGTFRFTPLAKGVVEFTFDFAPGATTETNLAESKTARDILGKVENARYIFR